MKYAPTWFEYLESKTRAISYDLLDWPDIVVTESELPEPDFPLTEGDA